MIPASVPETGRFFAVFDLTVWIVTPALNVSTISIYGLGKFPRFLFPRLGRLKRLYAQAGHEGIQD